jgi:GTP cyclohydrolase I
MNTQHPDLNGHSTATNGNGTHGNSHHHPSDTHLLDPELLENYEVDLEFIQNNVAIEHAVRDILTSVGEDPDREGLRGTPDRVARMYGELLEGYHMNPAKLVNNALFDVDYQEMVIVQDIDFFSLCEHHMLPFYGRANVAYIPDNKVIGLSKIPRIVDMFARRLQVQERMTQQIADFVDEVIEPQGVAVVVEGLHMCSMMRGVKKANSWMVTSAMSGVFRNNDTTRAEFMAHIQRQRNF